MGLLDDAIREHLEMRRLKGADPGEIARQEQDALGSESHDPNATLSNGIHEQGDPDGGDAGDERAGLGPDAMSETIASSVGQETMELDMGSVLSQPPNAQAGREANLSRQSSAEDHAKPLAEQQEDYGEEDSLEWEVLSEHPHPEGQGDQPTDRSPGDESVEDVLEETPDFLRETPEQDRLWFEQRPPRDFDFNE